MVEVPGERAADGGVVERRTCANPECRTNGPTSQQRFGDKV